MVSDQGFDREIRCRFISEWFKIDSYIPSKERLLAEIEKNRPDVVVMDLDLWARINGIETSRIIRNQFKIPVMYFQSYKPSIEEW
jgi:chemotaxis response regulator CheB